MNGKEYTRTGYGKLFETSENELVLMAFYCALMRIKGDAGITIYTGNRYLIGPLANAWVNNWQQAGWRNKSGREVAHAGLWKEIAKLISGHKVMIEPDKNHKYSYWQMFQLGKMEPVNFTRWEEGKT